MDKKKKVLIILLVFVLLFGGASVLYKQLGKNADANQLSSETDVASEEQDDKDEAEDERAMAPDMTVYDRDGKEVHLSDYIGKPISLYLLTSGQHGADHARWKCRILMRSIRSLEKKYSF